MPAQASDRESVCDEALSRFSQSADRRRGNKKGLRSRQHLLRREQLWGVVIGSFALMLLGAALFGFRLEQLKAQRNELENEVRTLQAALAQAQADVATQQSRVASILANRLPGLATLDFDRVIPLSNEYFRHIQFTELLRDGLQSIEVRLVLNNPGKKAEILLAEVFLFDAIGVELVSATLTVDGGPLVLEPGESQPLTVEMQPKRGGEPTYFMVRRI